MHTGCRNRSKVLLYLLPPVVILDVAAIVFVHAVIRPKPTLMAIPMDAVLVLMISLPIVGYLMRGDRPHSSRQRAIRLAAPFILVAVTVVGGLLSHILVGLGIGAVAFVGAFAYYFVGASAK